MRIGFVNWIQTFFTLTISKISICLLLLRIVTDRKLVRPIQSLIAFLVVSAAVIIFLWIFQCNPIDAEWDRLKRENAKCFTKGQVQRVVISQAS